MNRISPKFGINPGMPGENGVYLGPLTRRSQPGFLLSQVEDAVSKGAQIRTGGHRMERRGTPVSPAKVHAVAVTSGGVETIHADASNDHDPRWLLMKEMQGTWLGSLLDSHHTQLYGWVQQGFAVNPASPSDRINFGANENCRSGGTSSGT